ncbi:nuclear transport factor 2 family protein [Bradyrhizobium sp. CCBAU 21360]|uniref:nuclear transport factor 2 family protein n=1 Tax=Bradyrhizobium sp. CCBAU 21360 TaxID=1325081 RepID=UPI002305EEED|nr:nuclear transport factor 2 family protein [Bradyrhizobium sp. CCBAU 21360]MDA9445720.1 ketosteroid isomerase [Bradyrhizobium sp. CCBAU 21360]
MEEHCFWRFSRTMHRAINERRLDDLEVLIDEEIDWSLYGPIDMFPCLGVRHGKRAVLDVIRNLAEIVQIRRFDRETTMLGMDRAASMLRCFLVLRNSDRPISLRVAQFARFKAGRLVDMRVLVDTFELVEQALGRSIHLPRMIDGG